MDTITHDDLSMNSTQSEVALPLKGRRLLEKDSASARV
jgi:hypothetical protein